MLCEGVFPQSPRPTGSFLGVSQTGPVFKLGMTLLHYVFLSASDLSARLLGKDLNATASRRPFVVEDTLRVRCALWVLRSSG